MKTTVTIKVDRATIYYLQSKYNTKAGARKLVMIAVLKAAAEQAKQELEASK